MFVIFHGDSVFIAYIHGRSAMPITYKRGEISYPVTVVDQEIRANVQKQEMHRHSRKFGTVTVYMYIFSCFVFKSHVHNFDPEVIISIKDLKLLSRLNVRFRISV